MANTFTTNYSLTKPEPGGANDTWGNLLNSDLDDLDSQVYNKVDKVDQKGVSHSLSFSGNNITTGTSNGFNSYVAGDRLYIANASSNAVNRGEFLIENVVSDTELDLKKADGTTDAGFTTETITSVVHLVTLPKFTRQGLTQLTGEIKLYASVSASVIQALGSITYAGGTRYFWLPCNGAAVFRTVYDDLFDVIGTSFGVGNGSTTFNVPDLRGRVPVGDDTIAGETATRMPDAADNIGNSGGVHEHTLTAGESGVKTHTHAAGDLVLASGVVTVAERTIARGSLASGVLTVSGNLPLTRDSPSDGSITLGAHTGSVGTATSGDVAEHAGAAAASAHSILQPYQVIGSYIIAT